MHVDAHQHFWDLSRGDYDWLTSDMVELYRDYGPEDIKPYLSEGKICSTVLVQAAPTHAETQYLLEIAKKVDWVRVVVGWADFEAQDVVLQIQELSRNKYLKGLRPMVQSYRDVTWLLRPNMSQAFEAMERCGLCLDALVQPRHLDVLAMFVQRHPDLKIVIDHGAKPNIKNGDYSKWAKKIGRLSKNENVYCKLSGLWSEAGGNISEAKIAPFALHLLRCFGSERLMWGSDWPVLNEVGNYQDWLEQSQNFISHLSQSEQSDILGKTARRFYEF